MGLSLSVSFLSFSFSPISVSPGISVFYVSFISHFFSPLHPSIASPTTDPALSSSQEALNPSSPSLLPLAVSPSVSRRLYHPDEVSPQGYRLRESCSLPPTRARRAVTVCSRPAADVGVTSLKCSHHRKRVSGYGLTVSGD